MLHRTSSGCCEKQIGSSKAHIPQCCDHGEVFIYAKQLGRNGRKRRSPLKKKQRVATQAERKARDHFNEAVKSWPCFFRERRDCELCEGAGGEIDPIAEAQMECSECEGDGQHYCSGAKDAHHLVEKQWIRRNYADLSEDRLLAILFGPHIGAPLCRGGHEGVKSLHIYWDEVSDECKEACLEVDRQWLDVPTPAGTRRQSMYARLEQECPNREEAALSGRSPEGSTE